jgi:hypothetical protein
MRGGVTDMKHVIAIVLSICIGATALSAAVSVAVCDNDSWESERSLQPVPQPDYFFPMGFVGNYEVRLLFDPSAEQQTAPVYRIVPEQVGKEYARQVSQKFGLNGDPEFDEIVEIAPWSTKGPCYRVTVGETKLEVMLSGVVLYRARPNPPEDAGEFVLGDDELEAKAKDFLVEHGLLPDGAEPPQVTRSGSMGFVEYRHQMPIDSSPPIYVGVAVDNDGNVVLLDQYWPELLKLGDYPVLSEREAYEEILQGNASSIPSGIVDLLSVSLVFQSATATDGSRFLVPVYRFQTSERGTDVVDVLALPGEYLLPREEGSDQDQ